MFSCDVEFPTPQWWKIQNEGWKVLETTTIRSSIQIKREKGSNSSFALDTFRMTETAQAAVALHTEF